jgi:hypothetical protein
MTQHTGTVENLKVHDSFCNALNCLNLAQKNVSEERDAPWQIVLGSTNTAFCVYASLSLWMEVNLRTNPNALLSPYLFSFCDESSFLQVDRNQRRQLTICLTRW